MSFGQALKRARKGQYLRQSDLAPKVGCHPNYISLLENDRRDPSLSFLIRLAKALEMPASGLLAAAEFASAGANERTGRRFWAELGQLMMDCHMQSCAKGFHSPSPSPGELIALIHSEASEALEAFREHGDCERHDNGTKPDGVPAEIADVVIRCFDFAGAYGFDLAGAIRDKVTYNATRPQRHGGKHL